jgi:hypothetical protein
VASIKNLIRFYSKKGRTAESRTLKGTTPTAKLCKYTVLPGLKEVSNFSIKETIQKKTTYLHLYAGTGINKS